MIIGPLLKFHGTRDILALAGRRGLFTVASGDREHDQACVDVHGCGIDSSAGA